VETGCLPNLLPGGRPVSDAGARVDAATAWGVDTLPEREGRDADAIIAATLAGEIGGLVVGGVDPDDMSDPQVMRDALQAAKFIVALELRETEVTRAAHVVFPVAPVSDKAGMFVTWEGRPRPFPAVFTDPKSLPDLRVLAGIAEELGRPLGFRSVGEARAQMEEMGPWDGDRPTLGGFEARKLAPQPTDAERGHGLQLATWKQLIDNGSMQDGDDYLRATARRPVARVSQAVYAATGPVLTLAGERGSITLPAEVADIPDGVVWVPMNSVGNGVLADLGGPGSSVTVRGADS
jgi:NADH-quinone oxidoreductase subunit G